LIELLLDCIPGTRIRGSYTIPYAESALIALCYAKGTVIKKEYLPEHVLITVDLDESVADRVKQYRNIYGDGGCGND